MAYFNVCPECGGNIVSFEKHVCLQKCCICGDLIDPELSNKVEKGLCCDKCHKKVESERIPEATKKMLSTDEYIEKLAELGSLMGRDLMLELMDLKGAFNLKDIPREQIKAFYERKLRDYERSAST